MTALKKGKGVKPRERVLAEKIAADLMTSGGGARADRLVLLRESGAYRGEIGGWVLAALISRIKG